MKHIPIIIVVSIYSFMLSCKQDKTPLPPENPYSTWYVNGEKFTTNEVRVDRGKARHIISAIDLSNRFYIHFNLGAFPSSGVFESNCSQQNPAWCCTSINYEHVSFINPTNGKVQAVVTNGHTQYLLSDTWFFNESDAQDSILVSGTFVVP